MKDFEIASGSVSGSDHRWSDKNNQDAICYQETDDSITAIVCDGCSEGKHSEVGAKIGAAILTQYMNYYLSSTTPKYFRVAIEYGRLATIAKLKNLITFMASEKNIPQLIIDHFLFTAVGVYINDKITTIFSIGDGVYILNNLTTELGPFPNNEPPYLAYGGLIKSSTGKNENAFMFHQDAYDTDSINSILIGTDGVLSLIKAADTNMPSKDEVVGNVSQFWTDNRYFINKDMVRRKLSLVNREFIKPIWEEHFLSKEKGLLPDDTSLVVIRREQ